jgi:glycosyltransferase involved in cell wall biosynthesis
MSKVLWLSDGGCHTGFGRVTHEVGERLVRDYGHEIHVLAINHRGDDYPSVLDPTKKTPLWLYRPTTLRGDDLYGNTRIIEMLGLEPDVVVMVQDAHMILKQLYENQFDPQRFLLQARPIIAYVPVDGYNIPPLWVEVLPKIAKMVAMSKFGQDSYPGSDLVPHGVDPDRFWPVSDQRPITLKSGKVLHSRKDCLRALGMDEDTFLILRVDSNSGRKDYANLIHALIPVMERNPKIHAWFHCEASRGTAATDIPVLLSRTIDRVDPDRFHFPGMYTKFVGWPDAELNALYNAASMFVSTSRGEGFGLTLAEAAMVGLPIVAQNVSAIPETVGPGAILVEPDRYLTVPSGEDVALPDPEAFSEAIERLYRSAGMRRALGEAGRQHVLSSFSWDATTKRFDEFIRELAVRESTDPVVGSERDNDAATDDDG